MTRRGFPHSDIPGSKLVCSSPRLIAAYCVLHRLLAPRHSPYALSSLTIGIRELTIEPASASEAPVDSPSSHPHLETLRVFCGSEKLPFAGYSVVKEHSRGLRLRTLTARGDSLVAALRREPSLTRSLTRRLRSRPSRFALIAANLALACQPKLAASASVSEGWWRIPGSNR